jgi:prolyl 4-hydroxylase
MSEPDAAYFFTHVTERLRSNDEIFGIAGNGLMLYLLRDFLSPDECSTMINLIEARNFPSKVMGAEDDGGFRTSRSAPLAWSGHPLVAIIDERIAALTGIPRRFQESVEGQRYGPGQEFKPHLDTFPVDQSYWPEQRRIGGQRTWTVMVCLNDPEAGGGTMFPNAGVRLKPRAGNLLAWSNLDAAGRINHASLHCGEPVEAGAKYILTKWHRERPFRPERRVRRAPAEPAQVAA